MKRVFATATTLYLLLPQLALASTVEGGTEEEKFDPSREWLLHDWVPIHLGPIDLSITKAVAYLMLGSLLTILICWFLMRWRLKTDPDRRQTVGEWIYEVAQTQIAEQGLPTKAIGRWFPYVASLALFIWVVNMVGFIPLPLSDEKVTILGVELPALGIYAATSTLSVTLTLALLTFVFTHVEGVRNNGFHGYFASWMPAGMPKLTLKWAIPLTLLYLLEVLGQFMRLVSLSVRLYANMLAGHMLILTFIGLMFVLESLYLAPFSVFFGTLFYAFEVLIVVSIQAYIFAALSAIYIGSAIEPEH